MILFSPRSLLPQKSTATCIHLVIDEQPIVQKLACAVVGPDQDLVTSKRVESALLVIARSVGSALSNQPLHCSFTAHSSQHTANSKQLTAHTH
jgi:hypothetical protein